MSGLILLFERPIQAGDTITVGTVMGEVKRIGIRASIVRDFDGAEVLVPNANLLSEMVINWTLSDRRRRMEILVGVAYGTDPRRVLELLRGVVEGEERLLKDPAPSVQFLEFGESSLDFRVRAWTDDFDNFWDLRSDLIVQLDRAILDAGIHIPFPQRDLHVRSIDPQITGSDAKGS